MIYFVEMASSEFIKVGFTAGKPERRIAQLQTGQPNRLTLLGTMPGDKSDEKHLHRELHEFRVNGEWFDKRIKDIILSLVETQGPWYACRGPGIKQKMLENEWKHLFVGENAEDVVSDFNEYQINCAVVKVRGLQKQISKFQSKDGKGKKPHYNHSVYNIISNLPSRLVAVASYVAAHHVP